MEYKCKSEHVSDADDTHLSDNCAHLLRQFLKGVGYFSIFSALPVVLGDTAQASVPDDKTDVRPSSPLPNSARRQRPLKPEFLRKAADYRLPYEKGRPEIFPSFTGSDDCPGTPIPVGNYTAATPYTDTGDTTGANDSVSVVTPYYAYSSAGPDRIYSFVVTSIGANPQITVTTTSPTYRPMIYVSTQCPAGVGQTIYDYQMRVSDSRWNSGSNTAEIDGWSWLMPFGARYYLYVDSSVTNDSGPYTLTIKDMKTAAGPAVQRRARPDFDGDGLLDPSVFRPGDGTWWIKNSNSPTSTVRFGLGTDKPVPEDYDGDGKTDIAVFRDGDWWILRSSDATPSMVHWGQNGDVPVPGDYNGDGRAELSIFRGGQWWTYDFATGQYSLSFFGLPGDKPVPGDYDGDGKTDQAVFRNGTWHLNRSLSGYTVVQWGIASDKAVPAYYDWDNAMDLAVYRDGVWYISWSADPIRPTIWNFGSSGDIPVPAHYDGIFLGNPAFYRNGTWFLSNVGPTWWSSGFDSFRLGQAGDIPLPGNTP